MKPFFLKTTILILISITALISSEKLFKWFLSSTSGGMISTEEQIDKSFNLALNNNYKTLIVGSSRIYRGVNPDKLTFSEAFNFGHDNDSYNQIFYKLLFLEKKKKAFNYLILGTDYFQFSIFSDTRNYVYRKYLDKKYLKDYKNYHWKDTDNKVNRWITIHFSNIFKFFTTRLKNIIIKKETYSYLTKKGQFVTQLKSDPRPINQGNNENDAILLQKKYFDKIFQFCKRKKITVFMVMPPARTEELKNISQSTLKLYDFFLDSTIKKQKGYYLNYAADQRFTGEDFADIAHLGKEGADKFSNILNQDIIIILEKIKNTKK